MWVMVSSSCLPQAPSEPLDDLQSFLAPLHHVHFVRSESRHAMERYLTGLLTEHPNKNCDTIALSSLGLRNSRSRGC